MKMALLFAFVFTEVVALGSECCAPPEIARGRTRSERLPVIGERVAVIKTERFCRPGDRLEPIGMRVTRHYPATSGTCVEGVALRVLTAPNPAQMINPLAPSRYGSSRGLVTYTDRDIYRTSNENKFKFQPDGIRLLTIRPVW